jgi:hypothetical protein
MANVFVAFFSLFEDDFSFLFLLVRLWKYFPTNNRRGNQEKTIQRNWQHMVYKTMKKKAKIQYVLNTTVRKQAQIT